MLVHDGRRRKPCSPSLSSVGRFGIARRLLVEE
jgi:hypothetical protein